MTLLVLFASPDLDLRGARELVRREAPELRLRGIEIQGTTARVGLEVPHLAAEGGVPTSVENAFEEVVGWLESTKPSVKVVHLELAKPGRALGPPPRPARISPKPPAPALPDTRTLPLDAPLPRVQLPPERTPHGQALAGRTVAVSPGHGYIYYASLGAYSTQRANIKWPGCGSCRGLVEDFGTHALVVRHLLPLLEGAGARVILLRERSENPNVELVDDGEPPYQDNGPFQNGSASGGHDGDYRAGFGSQAEARWTLLAPGGPAWLSTWYVAGSNRSTDGLLDILLPNGDPVELRLDQTVSGRQWVPLWRLDLPAGTPFGVRLQLPPGALSETALIADAVRIGAGRHESGHPWFQMGALPFAQLQAAPPDVSGRVDVAVRPTYAEWFGADAFVSIHSNATGRENSTTSGTVTYRYSCQAVSDHAPDPDPGRCDDPVGSDRLQADVHAALVSSLRSGWDPEWTDRGPKAANFGELRLLERIPGVLVETAFHDNVVAAPGARMTDNQALQDPRWRQTAAWGIYVGLTRFLVGPEAPLLAPPPTQVSVARLGAGRAELRFRPAEGALDYQVELAIGNSTFRPGPIVAGSPARLDLSADMPVGIRVRSVNAAGIGLPSRAVAVRAGAEESSLLVVDAFERRDAWVQTPDNRGDTALVMAIALEPSGVSFDGADEAALTADPTLVEGRRALAFALGRESTEHEVLSSSLRARLRDFVAGGGHLFLAGTEIGWAWDARGNAESRAFLREVLGTRYRADDAASRTVRGVGPLAAAFGSALQPLSAEGEGRAAVAFPDVFAPEAGFESALEYGDGTFAAVSGPTTLVVGFGVEHLRRAEDRAALASGWAREALGDGPGPPRDAGSGVDAPSLRSDLGLGADVMASPDLGTQDVPSSGDASLAQPDLPPILTAASSTRAPIEGACSCQELQDAPAPESLGCLILVAWALWMRAWVRNTRTDRKSRAYAAVSSRDAHREMARMGRETQV
ncbi:MAG: N-acetylmuramoyl-L-alanine amidase [Myxococcota bacterium]